ncbi:DUF6488 family protein [Cellvibrio fibrivorans]|uniref:PepSY domain-containing protein n=1 Tax=Cellvibrio fibrivorans TaxID=126350 RepID=A0ABU1USG9_9GAMM|nr:DUF6488 family protein [Cellvibrio fibrivorans]MDR7088129.1 hypothetical protein [Cellvibrio fibrivorans]
MRRWLQVSSVVLMVLVAPVTQAHEGHEHAPVTMKKAVEIALATARDASINSQPGLGLAQLDQSWRNLPTSAAHIYENGRGYYLVSVANSSQAKTLYVRILLDGRVEAANFSGDFVSSVATSSAGK